MAYNKITSDWDMEKGYCETKNNSEAYPYRIFGTGKSASLVILMRTFNQDIDYLCGGAMQGFKASHK